VSDYYKHIYSQRDIDLIRGDLMARIAALTAERDALVEAWEQHDKARDDLSGAMESDPDYGDLIEQVERTYERLEALAQLKKSQSDSPPQE